MLYFVNNIDSILYKKPNSTSIDLRNQWEIARKTLNIIDTINIISSKLFPENSTRTVT